MSRQEFAPLHDWPVTHCEAAELQQVWMFAPKKQMHQVLFGGRLHYHHHFVITGCLCVLAVASLCLVCCAVVGPAVVLLPDQAPDPGAVGGELPQVHVIDI